MSSTPVQRIFTAVELEFNHQTEEEAHVTQQALDIVSHTDRWVKEKKWLKPQLLMLSEVGFVSGQPFRALNCSLDAKFSPSLFYENHFPIGVIFTGNLDTLLYNHISIYAQSSSQSWSGGCQNWSTFNSWLGFCKIKLIININHYELIVFYFVICIFILFFKSMYQHSCCWSGALGWCD